MDCGPMSWRFPHPVPAPHSHVSLNQVPWKYPPKSTWHSRERSNAIAGKIRSEGPVSAICVHSVPSHSHVSPKYEFVVAPGVAGAKPPESTKPRRGVSEGTGQTKTGVGP